MRIHCCDLVEWIVVEEKGEKDVRDKLCKVEAHDKAELAVDIGALGDVEIGIQVLGFEEKGDGVAGIEEEKGSDDVVDVIPIRELFGPVEENG